jgi:long-chain acyl-CoA synthetase
MVVKGDHANTTAKRRLTVPVDNSIHQAIMAQVYAGGLKGELFSLDTGSGRFYTATLKLLSSLGALLQRAIATKVENFKKTGSLTHPVYDRLVFRKVSGAPKPGKFICDRL